MAVLENVYHNFPRLAKQSGFYFQLPRGRVNWSEIENLDINEIIERRNFELLEQNLVNVTNCNLEKEYDSKIFDQNFVKLFKLAQLGVDYLAYCEMYLDRCVVLLQEQLITYQDECEFLKKEIQKSREANSNKNKNKVINYQCEKCSKVFISDIYLKYHEKRRHSSINTPESLDKFPRKCSCNCQQNENIRKLTTSTQTLFNKDNNSFAQEDEDGTNIKAQHTLKVEMLEQELQDLKERLKKAESALLEKAKSNVLHPVNVPNSMHCSSMVMLLPSCFPHLGNGSCEINLGRQILVPEFNLNTVPARENSEIVNKSSTQSMSEVKSESKKLTENEFKDLPKEKIKSDIPDSSENFKNYQSGISKNGGGVEKENVDPKTTPNLYASLVKPLPPPRKLKRGFRDQSETDITVSVAKDYFTEEKPEDFTNHLIARSTPVKEKERNDTISETSEESIGNISDISKPKLNSTESLQSKKSVVCDSDSKSSIKKIFTKDSLALQKFSRNCRKSLNNLYESVSSIEKPLKRKETNFQNLRTAVVDGLNNHLQQLGVSSEWSGIPKKTLRQKLGAWRHQRKLVSKENPLYPITRQNIEEKIFQKLKKNFGRKKANPAKKLSKSESKNLTSPEIQDISFEEKSEFIKNKNWLRCDTDTEFESRVSDSVKDFQDAELSTAQKTVIVEEISQLSEQKVDVKNDQEFDISVFQVGGNLLTNPAESSNQKPILINENDIICTDSDTENSLVNFNSKSPKSLKSYLMLHNEVAEDYENETPLKLPPDEKAKADSQSILKDRERYLLKPVTNTPKKVLFASYSKSTKKELSDNSTEDDDLWSLKGNWENENVTEIRT